MLKVHIYHGNGKSSTIKASDMIGLTILREDSKEDKFPEISWGRAKKGVCPKGSQLVMLEVTENDGELFISNLRTDERIKL